MNVNAVNSNKFRASRESLNRQRVIKHAAAKQAQRQAADGAFITRQTKMAKAAKNTAAPLTPAVKKAEARQAQTAVTKAKEVAKFFKSKTAIIIGAAIAAAAVIAGLVYHKSQANKAETV